MKRGLFFLFLIVGTLHAAAQSQDEEMLRKIYNEALVKGRSYEMLRQLTKGVGARLSGSPQAAAAVEWGRQQMEEMGFDTVWLQPVMVPHWVRGEKEKAFVLNSKKLGKQALNIVALGNSVGTGPEGLIAPVIEVKSFEELEKLGKKKVEGKIVFFNYAMKSDFIHTFQAYGDAARYRSSGPSEAAKFGAVGAIVRSLTTEMDDIPHTGSTRYALNTPKIPAVAISTNDAALLSDLLKGQPDLTVYLETTSKMLKDELSFNVVGEIRGSEKPEEIIVVGGHLDSWDLGEGAHDDGAGVVQSMEVLRIMKGVGYKPKRTIRAVLFMNEENGLKGGIKYAEVAEQNKEKHIAGLESDSGGFTPISFSVDSDDATFAKMQKWEALFRPYHIYGIEKGYGGADISPLKNQGVPLIGYRPDSQRYFNYHHTAEDTFEKVNKRELELGAAAMASLVYLIDQYGL